LALSTIGTVVVPVICCGIVVVVDVEEVEEVDDVVPDFGFGVVVPNLRKLAIMALSRLHTGRRTSWPSVVVAPLVGRTSVERLPEATPR
jgi:hypothetical protein